MTTVMMYYEHRMITQAHILHLMLMWANKKTKSGQEELFVIHCKKSLSSR